LGGFFDCGTDKGFIVAAFAEAVNESKHSDFLIMTPKDKLLEGW
jgi:hypothetical protein